MRRGPLPETGGALRGLPGLPHRSAELRLAFQETVGREFLLSESEAHYGGEMPPRVRATLRRLAIERALVAHGILEVRRRLIPLPKRFLFTA